MGQKVHPHGFRLGFNKTWRSRWFADKDYAKLLHEDLKLRETLKKTPVSSEPVKVPKPSKRTKRAVAEEPDLLAAK